MNEFQKHVLTKITSGRWLLTVIGGGVFAYATKVGLLKSETVAAILTMIFVSYFQKQDRKNGNGGTQ